MDNLKIGLGFSGGGFRAAAFNLGALCYLNHLDVNGKPMLEHVVALSTVSGGTITGAHYATLVKQGENFDEIYESLYAFLTKADLIKLAIDRLTTHEGWEAHRVKSLINAFADIYDAHLFKGRTFASLMDDANNTHLRHVSFNSTDFTNALQFRFQWSEKTQNPAADESARGLIGNFAFRLPENAAAEIRMADILAASSCFPGGFEPINFPTDFIHGKSPNLNALLNNERYRFGLMDGGIVDNQGIEPLLLADERMRRNTGVKDQAVMDLVIVSDVASPFMEGYQFTEQGRETGFRTLSPASLLTINTLLLVGSVVGLIYSFRNDAMFGIFGSAVLMTLTVIVYAIGAFLKGLPKKLEVPPSFLEPLGKLLTIKFRVYETMIKNRVKSVLKLSSEVFLKHVRRMNYNTLYKNREFDNRRIMNAIYELKPGNARTEEKVVRLGLSDAMKPSKEIQQIAQYASSMGTTLWFTDKEIREGMCDALIACGQFTMCWNLVEYVRNLKASRVNTTAAHDSLIAALPAIEADWVRFIADPYWMVKAQQSVKEGKHAEPVDRRDA